MLYTAINLPVFKKIPKHARRILDIGCGSAELGKSIKTLFPCEIVGITCSAIEAEIALKHIDDVVICDLNHFNTENLGQFDCIICSHVLEHLQNPDDLLKKLKKNLSPTGLIIIALPNVLHWKQRIKFLSGEFRYSDGGLMDYTHLRFFDWKTSAELINSSGYQIISHEADGYLPLPIVRNLFKDFTLKIDQVVTRISPGLFGVQFITIATAN